MLIIDSISLIFDALKNRTDLCKYRREIPHIVEKIRMKNQIKVLFVLSDLAVWKTESLYRAMLEHPRFEPILGLTLLTCDVPSETVKKYHSIVEYLHKKEYRYIELSSDLMKTLKPDIAFYQQPYDSFIADNVSYTQVVKNGGLICDVHYAIRTLAAIKKYDWVVEQGLYRNCWIMFMENDFNLEYGKLSLIKGANMVATGVPWQDELMKPKVLYADPWKPQDKPKKRFIYAPHHTLPNNDNLLNISCFLDVCDYMLEIAEQYSDSVQFAFKPHPFLKKKLVNLWGEEKTNRYYAKWDELQNCQLVEDGYIGLFKHSDALIHDCDSFTIEYCYIKKPILYLISPDRVQERRNDLNRFGQIAFDLHDHGFTKEEINAFVRSVIYKPDARIAEREDFYHKALIPPNGKTAVANIISSILGSD